LTTQQLVMSAFGSAIRLGHDPADRWLCCLPLHHVGGLSVLLRTASYGTTAILHPSFDPAAVAAADATMISLVPAMLERLLDGPGLPKKTRVALIGGGPTRPALLARCAGLPVALTWGMSEAASQISTRIPGDLSPDGGVGFPLPFVRVCAADDGALWVFGPIVGGRLDSADRGHVDPAGRVFVSGRRDDMIVSGGENIDPSKLEAALQSHPAVAEAAVAGVPSERWGMRPVAWLVPSGEARPDSETLRAHCQSRLRRFEIPDHFVWTDALPRTALGKLTRGRLCLSQPNRVSQP